jgi:hypothetical protein
MFSGEFNKYLENIQKESLEDEDNFIELFETKFMNDKKIFKINSDLSKSYYFDMKFSEFPPLDDGEIIKYKYFQEHGPDIVKKMNEYNFKMDRELSRKMTFNFHDEHNDNITNVKTIRFFFRF